MPHPFAYHPLYAPDLTYLDIRYDEAKEHYPHSATVYVHVPVPEKYVVLTKDHHVDGQVEVDFLPPIKVVVRPPLHLVKTATAKGAAAAAAAAEDAAKAFAEARPENKDEFKDKSVKAAAKAAATAKSAEVAVKEFDKAVGGPDLEKCSLGFECKWIKISLLKSLARLVDKHWKPDVSRLSENLQYLALELPKSVLSHLKIKESLNLRWKGEAETVHPGVAKNVVQGLMRTLNVSNPSVKNFLPHSILRDFIGTSMGHTLQFFSDQRSLVCKKGNALVKCDSGGCMEEVLPTRAFHMTGRTGCRLDPGEEQHVVCVECLRGLLRARHFAINCPVLRWPAAAVEPTFCRGIFAEEQLEFAARWEGPDGDLFSRARNVLRKREDFALYTSHKADGGDNYRRGMRDFPCHHCKDNENAFTLPPGFLAVHRTTLCMTCLRCTCDHCKRADQLICDCDSDSCTSCTEKHFNCQIYCGAAICGGYKTYEEIREKVAPSKYEHAVDDWISDGIKEARRQFVAYRKNRGCPCCFALIERSEGCPRMGCTECGVHFCWVCGADMTYDSTNQHTIESGCAEHPEAYE